MAGRNFALINDAFYLYLIDAEKTSANAASNSVLYDPTSSPDLWGAFQQAVRNGYDVAVLWSLGAVDTGSPSTAWGLEYQNAAGIWLPVPGVASFTVAASSTGNPILIESLPADARKIRLVMTDGGNLSASHDHANSTLVITGKVAGFTGPSIAKTLLS